MLPADSRLTTSTSFRHATRAGRRSGARTLVTHLVVEPGGSTGGSTGPGGPARVGFVVSKAVGGAVVRNRVKRRLRHAVRDRLPTLPRESLLVVRAQPPAAAATYEELASDLDRCLQRSLRSGSGRVER
ncbi:ribonuclease P protein component [Nocardioides sp. TF02-7]|uniref:ribonuclease P protein component n=1 Tax=Nocardioides sp. TF02-7 TaxID=2917724 RepID=UPI001F057B2A|nr:ribonuclease P protein component [Nocardioides sp. TF02-7]UMG94186.1 ribonuclease P protein component [Nocardioides sp. TF02-7]